MAKRDNGLCRSFHIDREKIDPEKRTVELSFSSEEPVERWGENEVLSHDKGHYDFSRLNNDHPLLLGHNESDPNSQIGVIESAHVKDKKGRAVVRFSKSAKAQEIFQDVQDGIRKLISVGYDRTGIVESKKDNNNMVTTRYRWAPTHIAIVPVPADTTVGVGRSINRDSAPGDDDETCPFCGHQGGMEIDGDNAICPECGQSHNVEEGEKSKSKVDSSNKSKTGKPGTHLMPEQTAVLDEAKIRTEEGARVRSATTDEIKARTKEIIAIADALIKDHGDKDGGQMRDKIRAEANKALTENLADAKAVDNFRMKMMEDILRAKPAVPIMLEDVTDETGRRSYSLLRGIQSAFTAREKGGAGIPTDGVEAEVHQEIMSRARRNGGLGYDAAGFQVPQNAPIRLPASRGRRDMQATVFPQGGAFVPTQLVVPIIEVLRSMMVLDKVGKRTMAGLQGNIVIPRQDAPATAYSVAEIAALTASQQVLNQIALNPKRVGATENYSKQLIFQSSPDVEAFIRDDLFKVIALKWDYLGLNGQGAASEPLGIMQTPGIGVVNFGATPTYIKMVAFRTAIRKANVVDPLDWISTPAVEGSLSTVAEALTGATTVGGAQNAIWKPGPTAEEGRMVGMPAFATNQMPNDQVLLGAFTHLIHALWGGLDVVVDIFTKAANAEVVLTINTWGDYALRHPQAFCVSSDSGAQ